MRLDKVRVMRIIKAALKEDIQKGDITTNTLISRTRTGKAVIKANEDCVVCGIDIAEWILSSINFNIRFKPMVSDGDTAHQGQEIAYIEGPARAILTGERTVLNFISFLSGIATETKKYSDITTKYGVQVLDTRKTLPLLRYLEKYAVGVGGGTNHRMHLAEMAMVKDNHHIFMDNKLDVQEMRKKIGPGIKIEVEVDNIVDFEKVLAQKPDIIMLDNMSPDLISKAIAIKNERPYAKRIMLEASGGITLSNIESFAKTGVDTISIGAITDSVVGIDFSLDII